MSGFSADWLALREAADHRARDPGLVRALAAHLSGRGRLRAVDLGAGTGSNLRALAPALGPEQDWTLVDDDPALLAAARERLRAWADHAEDDGAVLRLKANGRRISVAFRRRDLAGDVRDLLPAGTDLVTASALLDLMAAAAIDRLADAVATARAAFLAVLTYDGRQTWQPAHPADGAMAVAFHAHQRQDKGFGAAAGPDAPKASEAAFRARGYAVATAASPWQLGAGDGALIAALAQGFADAVAETGRVSAADIADWRAVARAGAEVGHADLLALPPA